MFIKPSRVKAYIHGKGRRVNRGFIQSLDAYVQELLDRSCKIHNGGRKTLDAGLGQFVFRRHT